MGRLCRALDFGPYANPVSLPKLFDAGELLVPPACGPLDAPSRLAPGTIVEMGRNRHPGCLLPPATSSSAT
jgi:hypothetical protein